jgi:hypothetical protein
MLSVSIGRSVVDKQQYDIHLKHRRKTCECADVLIFHIFGVSLCDVALSTESGVLMNE